MHRDHAVFGNTWKLDVQAPLAKLCDGPFSPRAQALRVKIMEREQARNQIIAAQLVNELGSYIAAVLQECEDPLQSFSVHRQYRLHEFQSRKRAFCYRELIR